MTQIEKIIAGLNACRGMCNDDCPYYSRGASVCRSELLQDAEEMLQKVHENMQGEALPGSAYSSRRLKLARELVGVSQKKLAELTGISYSAICKYETGNRRIDDAAAAKIADALGINVSRLVNLEDQEDGMKYASPAPRMTIEINDDQPITVAHKLTTALKPYTPGIMSRMLNPNQKEEIFVDMYSTSELREIANYLLVYCNAQEMREGLDD